MAASKFTTKQAIEKVLSGQRKPMTVAQITEAALPLTKTARMVARERLDHAG
jgi:hypothetical protein